MKFTLPTMALAAVLGLALAGVPVSAQAQTSTTTPATTTAPATKPAAAAKPTRYSGVLSAVDTTGNTITITDKTKAPRTIAITPTTKITKDKKPATLADFAVGEKVGGSYTADATGAMTATTLSFTTPKTKAKSTASTAAATATGTTTPAAH